MTPAVLSRDVRLPPPVVVMLRPASGEGNNVTEFCSTTPPEPALIFSVGGYIMGI